MKDRNYARVYMDYDISEGRIIYYVRVCPIETNSFPAGLGLSSTFSTEESAEEFADEVEDYMIELVKIFKDEPLN